MKRVLELTCLMLLVMALLLGCGSISEPVPSATPTPTPAPLPTMNYVGIKVYDPVYIGIEKGFFKEAGVDLKLIDLVAGGPTGIQAVAGGSADAGISSYMAIINARAAGLPIVAVTDAQSAIGKQALEEFFVRNDSGIKSVKDLKGKKIAVNLIKSSFYYTWLMALEKEGMTEKDVEFVLLPFDQQEIALAEKRVDAIGLMQPYVLRAKESKDYSVLFTALDVFGAKQFSCLFVNSVWAKSNEVAANAFVAGVTKSIAWAEANQADAKPLISKYSKVDIKYIEDYHWQANGAVILPDAQYWLDYMKGRKDMTAEWLNVEDFATNKYNKAVK